MMKAKGCTLIRLCSELMSGLSLLLLSRCLEKVECDIIMMQQKKEVITN